MKFLSKFIVPIFSLFTALVVSPGITSADEEPLPTDQDEYSGKKIESLETGYKIIRDRFFNAPKYGDKAPEFELVDQKTGELVSLKSLRAEKPVVLLFGSFGCDVMRDGIGPVLKAYETHGREYHFVLVYIREAHSMDNEGEAGLSLFSDPVSIAGRSLAASSCRAGLKIPFQILIDSMDDPVATRWAGWPVRLFVIEKDGIVAYSGKPGPWGFHPGGGFQPSGAKELRSHEDRFNQESLEEFLAKHVIQK